MDLHEITRDLEKLDAMYTEQINSFDKEILPDLETHTKERKEAIDKLKTNLAILLPALEEQDIVKNQGRVEEIMGHLKLIAKQNTRLKTRVQTVKEELKASMDNLKTGKKAINAYRAPQSMRDRPKVLTIRNY